MFRGGVEALTSLFSQMAEALQEINKSDIDKIAELRKELGLAAPEADKTGDALVDMLDAQEGIGKDRTAIMATNDLRKAQEDLLNALLEKQRIDKENEDTFNKQSTERARKDAIDARGRIKRANEEIALFDKLAEARDNFRKSIIADVPGADFADLVSKQFDDIVGFNQDPLQARGLLPSNEDIAKGFQIFADDLAKQVESIEKSELERAFESFLEFEQLFQDQLVGGFMNSFNEIISLQKANLDQRVDNELKALRKTDKFRNASMEQRQTMEDDVRAKFAKNQKRIFELQKAMSISQVIIDTATSINKLMAAARATMNPAVIAAARGMSGVMGAFSVAQIATISKQQAPAFARGGSFITGGKQMIMVGDNPGGRERVDITPLSSPDFGDAGGSGSINVNIMGNVIGTQEFVRDNLLPEIENSIKRNLA